MKKSFTVAVVVASLFALAAPAFAEETAKDTKAAVKETKSEKNDKGYGYAFDDDPLSSGVSGTMGFVLKVRPKGAREVLLKPRTSFVQEMLKSVEAM